MRRSLALFAAAFLLAGCGGTEPTAAAPSSPAPAAGGSWMDGFCGSLIDFAKIGEFRMPDSNRTTPRTPGTRWTRPSVCSPRVSTTP
ncbi:hypothetical protein [Amycolatopsis sp. cmx-11-12]|uniref:hypothetical protein n=1 Tax=Amycolatopsis sp. cmx-11-12 TaxID=2785795 RepID=UPI003917F90D